jgi:L-asparaginase
MAEKSIDQGVLIIYTGGTIGSLHKDPHDLASPLAPISDITYVLKQLRNYNNRTKKIRLDNQLVKLDTVSWSPGLDSSNIHPSDWMKLASIIKKNYHQYSGFVILHGTDTLAYTASALSFMLDNLDKPVILTGAQRPIGFVRSDARQNLITSIEIAASSCLGRPVVPEVCIFFRDSLIRGNRSMKTCASSYNAFESPNLPPLAQAGEHIEFFPKRFQTASPHHLTIAKKLQTNILCIKLIPGMNNTLLKNLFKTKGLKGVVLESFGTGNAPDDPKFLASIEEAVNSGVIIMNVTQCKSGMVEQGLYEASTSLLSRGVITGLDMTPEAALTKMFVILGQIQDPAISSDILQLNLKGEQKHSLFHIHFPDDIIIKSGASVTVHCVRPMVHGPDRFRSNEVKQTLLQMIAIRPEGEISSSKAELRIFIDEPDATTRSPFKTNPHFLGKVTKSLSADPEGEHAFIDVTTRAERFIDNKHLNSLTIVNTGTSDCSIKKLQLQFICNC